MVMKNKSLQIVRRKTVDGNKRATVKNGDCHRPPKTHNWNFVERIKASNRPLITFYRFITSIGFLYGKLIVFRRQIPSMYN